MVFRLELSHTEILKEIDMKYIDASTIRHTLPPGVYEISDIDSMIKSLLPDGVKVNFTIDDISLKSNLTKNNTPRFTEKSIFHSILGFTQSLSRPLGDIEGFVQLIRGTFKGDKSINITGIDKIHLKCECIHGSVVNAVRQSILYFVFPSSTPRRKNTKNQESNFSNRKINLSCHIKLFI